MPAAKWGRPAAKEGMAWRRRPLEASNAVGMEEEEVEEGGHRSCIVCVDWIYYLGNNYIAKENWPQLLQIPIKLIKLYKILNLYRIILRYSVTSEGTIPSHLENPVPIPSRPAG